MSIHFLAKYLLINFAVILTFASGALEKYTHDYKGMPSWSDELLFEGFNVVTERDSPSHIDNGGGGDESAGLIPDEEC